MPSSVVSHIHYDKAQKLLTVVFVSGAVYHYKKVPESVYEEMRTASSKGTFLNTRIKGHFDFEKIS